MSGHSTPHQSSPHTPLIADSPNHYSSPDAASRSVDSTVYEFQEENGRTYHGYKAGSYMYPNDETEIERLDRQHAMYKHAFKGRNYFAPLSKPRSILDIGTGTGIWAIEMGDEFPNATIHGTDLSPIQPTEVPENVNFFIDDATEEDWAIAPASFDYIHTRLLLGCFDKFRDVIRKGFYYTSPGGYMESQELLPTPFCDDKTMPNDWPLIEWSKHIDQAGNLANRPVRIAHKLKRWYEEAGFVDVQEKIIRMPVNGWPKDKHAKTVGKLSEANFIEGLGGFTMAPLFRNFGWNKTEIEVFLVNVRKAISDRHVHAYFKVYVVWGRRPKKPRS
ncbi:related to methyltransferase [Rhynchosporium agropyri]|uniref:Related to methyltransferase n=2 Tax=Rhynchosporium TaxID=38037 RepID=A0A1E1KRZ5_9HELO|nr:related to methyltransferase [Rhynchosporium agropyri]CZT06414.1 related to methyltransferase [Rhynchosporium commune]